MEKSIFVKGLEIYYEKSGILTWAPEEDITAHRNILAFNYQCPDCGALLHWNEFNSDKPIKCICGKVWKLSICDDAELTFEQPAHGEVKG